MRDRSHSLEAAGAAGLQPPAEAAGAADSAPHAALEPEPADAAAGRGGRRGEAVVRFESPPQSRPAAEPGRDGAMGSSPTMGLRLDVDAAPEVRPGLALAGPSPYAPGENDELTRFGSEVRGARGFDLFASTGTAGYVASREKPGGRKGGDGGGGGGGEATDEAVFDTIVKGSSKKGLPFGVNTPVPPGATGGLKPGQKQKKGPMARFENTFVPEHFPGRRVGDRDDEDIGSSDDGDVVEGWRRWVPRFLGGGKRGSGAVPDPFAPPSASDAPPTPVSADPKWSGQRKESFFTREIQSPMSSWNLGTSVYFSAVPLVAIRLILLVVAVTCLAAIVVTAVTSSESPWKALLTSSLPYSSLALVAFLFAAAVSSWLHLLQPTREIRDRYMWKVAAVAFNSALLLSVTQLFRFLLLSAVSSLRASSLTGASAVFSFGSMYAITVYVILLTSVLELFLNNVPLRTSYLAFPFCLSTVLTFAQVGIAPSVATFSVGAGMLVLSSMVAFGLLYVHGLQRKHTKKSLDKESTFEEFSKGYKVEDDDEDVAYESPHVSGSGSQIGSVGASRV